MDDKSIKGFGQRLKITSELDAVCFKIPVEIAVEQQWDIPYMSPPPIGKHLANDCVKQNAGLRWALI